MILILFAKTNQKDFNSINHQQIKSITFVVLQMKPLAVVMIFPKMNHIAGKSVQ